ncbi:MAG: hypothetical protein E3J72_04390 [Planctomycetota bacterium]|nr:MAG: hypothetical protein E3J72_04390 [Planctomycetota bacterium]
MAEGKQIIAERFEAIEELALGTLGPVMLVRDRRSEWQKRVLRIVDRAFAEPAWVERYEHEFRELAKINHPNLVRLFDFGRYEDRFFYTAEYVRGTSLETWAPGKKPDEVLAVFGQVLRGLHALHAGGFIHGNVKPENIIILETPAGFHAKLVDPEFVTRPLAGLGRRFPGSAAYLAPEIARVSLLDGRADLYASGVSLYETFAGRRPVPGATVHDLLRNLDSYVPIDIISLAPDLPPAVGRIIMRLLSRNPIDRFGDSNRVIELFSTATGKDMPLELEHGHPGLLAGGVVGRENVEEQFRTFLTNLGGSGCNAMILCGPSGSGRSIMLDELSAVAHMEDFRIIRADVRPHETADAGIRKIAEGIISLAGPARGPAANLPATQALSAYASATGSAPARAVTLLNQLLEIAAKTQVLVVIDDIHLSGRRRREFLLILLNMLHHENKRGHRLAVLMASENPALPEALASLFMREELVETVELLSIDLSASRRIIAGLLGDADPPEDFVRVVHEASAGLPRSVVETIRLAAATGVLSRDPNGHWTYPEDPSVVRPETPADLVKKRLENLPDQPREVAGACVTFRGNFTLEDLGNLLRERPVVLYPVVRGLIAEGFIREEVDGSFRIAGSFLRGAIAAAMPERHFKAHNRRLGMHHLALSERGDTASRLLAAHYLIEAGDKKYGMPLAMEVVDKRIASGDAETAKSLLELIEKRDLMPAQGKEERLGVLERAVRAASILGSKYKKLEALGEAVTTAKTDPKRTETFLRLALEQAVTALSIGELDTAGTTLAALTGSSIETTRLRPQITAAAAELALRRGEAQEALNMIKSALAADPDSDAEQLKQVQAKAFASLGRLEEALAACDTAIDDLSGKTSGPEVLSGLLIDRCAYLRRLGRLNDLEETARTALNLVREHRLHRQEAELSLEHSRALLARGQFQAADEELGWAAILALVLDERFLAVHALVERDTALTLDGRTTEAATHARRAYTHALSIESTSKRVEALRRTSWSALVRGDFSVARSQLDTAETAARRIELTIAEATCNADGARLAFLQGNLALSEALARSAYERLKPTVDEPHAFRPAELILEILFVTGRYGEIPGELKEILDAASKAGAFTVVDTAHVFRARWMILMGQHDKARKELVTLMSAARKPFSFLLLKIAELEISIALSSGNLTAARNVLEQLGTSRFAVATPLERFEWEILLCRQEAAEGNINSALQRIAFLARLPFIPGSAFYRHRLLIEEGATIARSGGVNLTTAVDVLQRSVDEAKANGYLPVVEEAYDWLANVHSRIGDASAAQLARDHANQAAAVIKSGLSESDAAEYEKALAERRSRRIIQSPDSLPTQSAQPAPSPAPAEQVQPQETQSQKDSGPSPDTAEPEPGPPAGPAHRERPRKTKVVDPAEAMGELPLPAVKKISKLSHADFSKILAQYERAYIEEILERSEGNKMKAAKEMGISRAALYRIMKRLGID